jgi:hypothetical protein
MVWCLIINVSCVIKGEFPPGLREASLQSHGFFFIHQCSNDPFRVAVLLVRMRDGLEDLDPFFLEHCCKC